MELNFVAFQIVEQVVVHIRKRHSDFNILALNMY